MGKLDRDSDSEDDDYSDGGLDGGWLDEEVEIDPADEAAMAAFRVHPRPLTAALRPALQAHMHAHPHGFMLTHA